MKRFALAAKPVFVRLREVRPSCTPAASSIAVIAASNG
jgi:hypothetical protein